MKRLFTTLFILNLFTLLFAAKVNIDYEMPDFSEEAIVIDKLKENGKSKDSFTISNFSYDKELNVKIWCNNPVNKEWELVWDGIVSDEQTVKSPKTFKIKDVRYFAVKIDSEEVLNKIDFSNNEFSIKIFNERVLNHDNDFSYLEIKDTNLIRIDLAEDINDFDDNIKLYNKILKGVFNPKFIVYRQNLENQKWEFYKTVKLDKDYGDSTEICSLNKEIKSNPVFIIEPVINEKYDIYCYISHDDFNIELFNLNTNIETDYPGNDITVKANIICDDRNDKGFEFNFITVSVENETKKMIKTKYSNSAINFNKASHNFIVGGMKYITAGETVPIDKMIPQNELIYFDMISSNLVKFEYDEDDGWEWEINYAKATKVTCIICLEVDAKDYYWTVTFE